MLIDRVGRFERFGLLTLLNNFCISCVDELLGTGVPWVSLPGPTGVMTHPGKMMSHQSANPILLLRTGILLHCTEVKLDYTDCTLDVFTLATLPNLTNAVYSSCDAGKSNQIET